MSNQVDLNRGKPPEIELARAAVIGWWAPPLSESAFLFHYARLALSFS